MTPSLRCVWLALPLLAVACKPGSKPSPEATPEPLKPGAAPLAKLPAPSPAAVKSTARHDLALGAKLLAALPKGNATLSPWSISEALALAAAGAHGDTSADFRKVLHADLDDGDWHAARGETGRALSKRGAGAAGADGGPFRLSLFNRMYGAKSLEVKPGYVRLLDEQYRARLDRLDFAETGAAVKRINGDVSQATAGLIPNLLSPDAVDASTRLVLVNAVYFNGGWKSRFDPQATHPAPFHLEEGKDVDVPTMTAHLPVRSAVVDGVQLLELPYSGDEVSMVVAMPEAGGIDALVTKLGDGWLDSALAQLSAGRKTVFLPKFKVRSQAPLKKPLVALGLDVPFTGAADFAGIADETLSIDEVIHEAVVETKEEGTIAAAATAVMLTKSISVPQEVVIDRPFVFLIRDVATGAPLFLGRVLNPGG